MNALWKSNLNRLCAADNVDKEHFVLFLVVTSYEELINQIYEFLKLLEKPDHQCIFKIKMTDKTP